MSNYSFYIIINFLSNFRFEVAPVRHNIDLSVFFDTVVAVCLGTKKA